MKLDAIKHQGKRSDLTCTQNGHKLDTKKSVEIIAENAGDSKSQVIRYIRLTELIPELLDMVDEKKINFNSAVEISHLTPDEQQMVCETIESEGRTPSVAQAQEIKRLSQKKQLNEDTILPLFEKKEDIRTHQKQEIPEPQKEQVRSSRSSSCSIETTKAGKVISIPMDQFSKYFPNRTEEQIILSMGKMLMQTQIPGCLVLRSLIRRIPCFLKC